jgi:hypothetical protein
VSKSQEQYFLLVRNEYLIAVELYLVLLQVEIGLDFREVQDTSKVERIIHVEMYPEQRFIGHRIEVTIELLVILVFQFGGLAASTADSRR